jgi:tetratricopeptide (TPR) repeat protein
MNETRGEGPADRLRQLWREGRLPDLDDFLAAVGPLSAHTLGAIVRVDQAARWCKGEPVLVEDYLRRFPAVASDPGETGQLILNEFILAESRGRSPDPEEFLRRFPAHADALRPQLDWHRSVTTRGTVDTISVSQRTAKLESAGGQLTVAKPPEPAPGVVAQPARELPNPFGRYQILELLGRGGMGSVYAAHDPQLDRRVALKVPGFGTADGEVIDHFLREARIAAHFNDPHLCPVYEVGEVGGTYYLTMPVIEGQTLADLLRTRGPVPLKEAVRVTSTLARAMANAHSAGVIHRDLKPANIFLNTYGQPVITDFGQARKSASGTESAGVPEIVGSPAYMAPEQVSGEVAAIGPATDIYALGVVLYEMLAGARPFEGPLGALLAQILRDDPAPPSRRRSEVDSHLSAICCRALAKKPADRYASMSEFADALDNWLASTEGRGARRARRLRQAVTAVAAATLAILFAFVLWRPGKSSPPEQVPPPAAAPTRDPEAAMARAELAWRLNNDGDLDRAVEESNGALRLDDRCVSALLCRGNALVKKHDAKSAALDLERAIELDPTLPDPHVDLAWAYNVLGEHEKAAAHAIQAVALQPDSAEAYNQAGWAHFKLGRPRVAIADYTNAIQHNPRYSWAYRNRALAYKEVGEDALAAADEAKADELTKPGG